MYGAVLVAGLIDLVAYVWVAGNDRSAGGPFARVMMLFAGAAIGFGMAGLSASFAGWNTVAHVGAALGAAFAGAGYVHWVRKQPS